MLCSDSGSYTDTALIDIVSEHSGSFEEKATLCEDSQASESLLLSLPSEVIVEINGYLSLKDTLALLFVSHHFFEELYKVALEMYFKNMKILNLSNNFYQFRLKGYDKLIYLNNTARNRASLSMALENGSVKCVYYKTPVWSYSSIDCQFVDKLIISFFLDGSRTLLENESFLKSKWKKVHFLVESQPLSFEGFYSLISKMSFEELRFRVPRYRNNLAWSELFASLGEETRKKMHIEGCHFAMDLPDFASIRSHATLLGKTALIQTMESNGLLQFMRKRPLLMELEVKLLYLEDFEKFQDFIQCDDLKKLDRELKITLCYEDLRSGEYFEYSFPSQ